MRSLIAQAADIGLRADIYLAQQYPKFSRSSLDGLFDDDLVRLGKKPIKGSYRLKAGDELKVDDELIYKAPPPIDLPIIYEDDDVIVINKPAGLLTHAKGAISSEATIASFISSKLSKDMPEGTRAGIIHRLDRATSGVIITAKNPRSLSWLQKQFSNRQAKKTYLAIVDGSPNPPQAVIDVPIARNSKKPQTFQVYSAGKPAQTEYRLVKALGRTDKFSLVELKPRTGRTHQLRVHLAYINHPIVGDGIYGHPADHMYLHAKCLELTLPSGKRKLFEADWPKYFEEFISHA